MWLQKGCISLASSVDGEGQALAAANIDNNPLDKTQPAWLAKFVGKLFLADIRGECLQQLRSLRIMIES